MCMAAQLRPWAPGLRGAGSFLHTPLPPPLFLSHTDAQNYVYTPGSCGAGGAVMGPCACVMVRVGGCEGGWAERLPWHSALGVGLPHSEGEEVGGTRRGFRERPRASGPPARARGVHWRVRGTLGGWPRRPCCSPSGPLAPPSGSHQALAPGKPWESGLSGWALSASDFSQADPSHPCTAPPHPGDGGVFRERLPRRHCPLLIEFPVP